MQCTRESSQAVSLMPSPPVPPSASCTRLPVYTFTAMKSRDERSAALSCWEKAGTACAPSLRDMRRLSTIG